MTVAKEQRGAQARLNGWQPGARRAARRRRHATVLLAVVVGAALLTSTPASADPIFPPPPATEPPPETNGALGQFHPLTPARVLDTRTGVGGVSGKVGPGATITVDVTGPGGVPATGVASVVLNVAVTQPTASGFLTVFPSGSARPTASNLNFVAGQTVPNLVVAKVGADGKVKVFNSSGSTHVIFDVAGWNEGVAVAGSQPDPGSVFHPLVPARVLDTRTGVGGVSGKVGPGATITVDVTGPGGVPATGVASVVLNVAVTQPTASGFLTVFPSGSARPTASNLNFVAGQTVPNLVVAKVGADGKVKVFNSSGSTHVIFDVAGWYGGTDPSLGGQISSLVPARVLDTRTGVGGVSGKVGPGATITVDVTGPGGVPATGVASVVLNVAVTQPTASGFLTVFPSGSARPTASNLNFVAGQTVPNLVVAKVGADGKVRVFNSMGSTHVIFDVAGWYTAAGYDPDVGAMAVGLGASSGPGTTETLLPTGVRPAGEMTVGTAEPVPPPRELTMGTASAAAPPDRTSTTVMPAHDGVLNRPDDAGYVAAIPQVGRIYMTKPNGGGGTCSGTVVARNLVLTAAHCIQGSIGWSFVPGQYGTSQPYGTWSATGYAYPSAYDTTGLGAYDWGFLQFNTTNGAGQYLGDVVGSFPILYDSVGGPKWSMGYPSEGWFSGYCSGSVGCYPYHCADRITDPGAQYFRNSVDASVSYGGWWEVGYGCYMTGGSSGGPVFEYWNGRWYVNGVNSHLEWDSAPTYTVGCTRLEGVCYQWGDGMWSPYFNNVIAAWHAFYAIP